LVVWSVSISAVDVVLLTVFDAVTVRAAGERSSQPERRAPARTCVL